MNKRAKTYKIYTLGCKVNQYDSGELAMKLENAGLVKAIKNVDLAIINTCAVTQTAMNKSARMVKSAKKENPKARIVLAGCWPKVYDIKNVAGANFIMKKSGFKELIKLIYKSQIPTSNKILNPNTQNNKITIDNGRARYFIKIQDGCEQYCTYCIVPYTRGKLSSRGKAEVMAEIKRAVAAGYGEIVLSGIHLGLWGKEVRNKKLKVRNDLVGLLRKIIKIKNLGRVRLSSIEVTEVTDGLIGLLAGSDKICRHLHIPLQSGNDKILRLMNRPYGIKNYELKIKKIRKVMPDIAISTDVIVGFPGETEKDFYDTVRFIKKMKFSRLHVFPFSAHEKAPAGKLPGQVPENERLRRARELRGLGNKLAASYQNKFKGKNLEVVVERVKPEKIIGKTAYYFDLEFNPERIVGRNQIISQELIGKIVRIKNR